VLLHSILLHIRPKSGSAAEQEAVNARLRSAVELLLLSGLFEADSGGTLGAAATQPR